MGPRQAGQPAGEQSVCHKIRALSGGHEGSEENGAFGDPRAAPLEVDSPAGLGRGAGGRWLSAGVPGRDGVTPFPEAGPCSPRQTAPLPPGVATVPPCRPSSRDLLQARPAGRSPCCPCPSHHLCGVPTLWSLAPAFGALSLQGRGRQGSLSTHMPSAWKEG